jgi:hypothetical protein
MDLEDVTSMADLPRSPLELQPSNAARALEVQISRAYEHLLTAETRAARVWFSRQLALLVQQRSDAQIAFLERARGLRSFTTRTLIPDPDWAQ